RSAEEVLNPQREYLHGKLVHDGRTILVNVLRMFPRGFMVETPDSTDDSDYVLDDLSDWAPRTFDIRLIEVPPGRGYVSRLEFTGSFPVERFSIPATVQAIFQQSFERYGQHVLPLQVQSVGMSGDFTKQPLTCDLRIERRSNIPYEENVYFSQAPLP